MSHTNLGHADCNKEIYRLRDRLDAAEGRAERLVEEAGALLYELNRIDVTSLPDIIRSQMEILESVLAEQEKKDDANAREHKLSTHARVAEQEKEQK